MVTTMNPLRPTLSPIFDVELNLNRLSLSVDHAQAGIQNPSIEEQKAEVKAINKAWADQTQALIQARSDQRPNP